MSDVEGNINLHQLQLESDSSSCDELCDENTEGPLNVKISKKILLLFTKVWLEKWNEYGWKKVYNKWCPSNLCVILIFYMF